MPISKLRVHELHIKPFMPSLLKIKKRMNRKK